MYNVLATITRHMLLHIHMYNVYCVHAFMIYTITYACMYSCTCVYLKVSEFSLPLASSIISRTTDIE